MTSKYKSTYPPFHCYIYRGKNASNCHFSGISRTHRDFINSNIGAEKMTGQRYFESIYQNCLQCSSLEYKEVLFFPCTDCPLWMIRFGITPDDLMKINGKCLAIVFNKSNFREGVLSGPEKSIVEIEMNFAKWTKRSFIMLARGMIKSEEGSLIWDT